MDEDIVESVNMDRKIQRQKEKEINGATRSAVLRSIPMAMVCENLLIASVCSSNFYASHFVCFSSRPFTYWFQMFIS